MIMLFEVLCWQLFLNSVRVKLVAVGSIREKDGKAFPKAVVVAFYHLS
jgi:hypothetical protein